MVEVPVEETEEEEGVFLGNAAVFLPRLSCGPGERSHEVERGRCVYGRALRAPFLHPCVHTNRTSHFAYGEHLSCVRSLCMACTSCLSGAVEAKACPFFPEKIATGLRFYTALLSDSLLPCGCSR